jgi:hypothetical protein
VHGEALARAVLGTTAGTGVAAAAATAAAAAATAAAATARYAFQDFKDYCFIASAEQEHVRLLQQQLVRHSVQPDGCSTSGNCMIRQHSSAQCNIT